MINIIGRKPSKAILAIVRKASIPRYRGKRSNVELLINYGLAGDQLDRYYRKFPSAKRISTINGNVGYSKLSVVQRAANRSVEVPESKVSLSKGDKLEDFIEKSTNSIGGIGIRKARGRGRIAGKYYQRFIKNRVYELRVHAFKWTKDWVVQKRVGPEDVIAWNFKQGGRFITVHKPGNYNVFKEARKVSDEVLDMLGMSFGAVDFIVDKDYKLYFIEINSAPGFTDLSEHIYIDAFDKLKRLKAKKLSALT